MDAQRWRSAVRASLWHGALSLVFAGAAAILVFGLWYPDPFSTLLGGRELFILLISVDVVCGPLLTLVLFNQNKSRLELGFDLGLVGLLQLAALLYGLNIMAVARPVYLGFAADRFQVIAPADLEPGSLKLAPAQLQELSWQGPRLLGVNVANSEDADYLEQVQRSIGGLDTAFRPDRWVPYESVRDLLRAKLKPIASLVEKHPAHSGSADATITKSGLTRAEVGWLPLASPRNTSWSVLVRRDNGAIVGFLPVDGF